jgi:hypothetical protein
MMNWLSEQLRRGSPARKRPSTAPRARPTLEALEDRLALSTLPSVEVTPVFLGPYWQSHGWDEFFLEAYTNGIVNSPFMDALQSYGVGRGSLSGAQTYAPSGVVAGATVSDATVQQVLSLDIYFSELGFTSNGSSLPLPDANRLYEVFLPPNVTFTATDSNNKMYSSQNGLTGWNGSFNLGGTQIHYVVIPYPGGTNASTNGTSNIDAFTETMSHEIAEAVTGYPLMADNTETWHFRMSNGVAIQEVGQLNNFSSPIAVAGATALKDISNWGM